MIKSFKDKTAEAIFRGRMPGKGFPADLVRVAQRKLAMLHAARTLTDLKAPPANQLEALKDDRKGQHAIRISQKWRLCFVWNDGAEDVEITDYH
ncbi:type II toxin-antitoxin system RelE/ParE family toxin [Xanthobacter autotrophicus]|uniref:type II toxin-antitoxin system RelE/ParE family toxin n=1 Tax=Xanthobacter autotrophicus TaxID=280 RepID=UPI0037292539